MKTNIYIISLKGFIVLFLHLLAPEIGSCQLLNPQPKFHQYTIEHGLPSSETYYLHQDKKGFIWICTDRGVVRFDGFKFTLFTKVDGLTDNVVFKIYEDFRGRIWFLTYNSKLCYFENDTIIPYKYNNLIAKNGLGFIASNKNLFIDKNDCLYFSEEFNGLTIIDKNGKLVKRNLPNGLTIDKVNGQILWAFNLKVDDINNRESIVATNNLGGLDKFITKYALNSRISIASSKEGDFILIDDLLYSLSTNKLVGKFENAISLNIIGKSIWIGKLKGGVLHFPNLQQMNSYHVYLSKYSVTSVLLDNEGGMWFSTLEKGVFYSPSMAIKNYSLTEGLIDEEINSISGIKNDIYLGFLTGKWQNVNFPNSINRTKVSKTRTIFGNSEDEIYVSTTNTHKIKNGKLSSLIFNTWSADFYFHEPDMYFGNQGIYKVNKKGQVDVLYHYTRDKSNNKKNLIQTLMVDNEKKVWVGTLSGLYFLDHGKLSKKGLNNPLFRERVSDLLYHPRLKKIVATRGEGIYFFDKDIVFKHLTKKKGLLSNIISVLYLDSEEGVWIGTSKGLNYISFDVQGKIKIESFTIFHGLCSNEVTSVYRFKNLVYVATKNGLSVIDLANFERNRKYSRINITNFETSRKVLDKTKYNVLNNRESFVKISFRNDNYRTLKSGLYQYRFNKGDTWVTTQVPDITLINPLPGYYHLEVKFQNEDGIWLKSQNILNFAIDDVSYKKPRFLVLMILGFGLIVWLLFKFRIKQIRTKHHLSNQIYHLEQKALQAQMNPHFIFNALNSIQSFLVYEENTKAEKYLLTFSQLIRSTLSNSREPNISIQNEMGILEKYLDLERMRFREKFEYEINILLTNQELSRKIPNMLIHPFVENAVIHGFSILESGGLITITVESVDENQIRCIIEDNGIGRKKAQQFSNKAHVSFATTITEERLIAFEKKHRIHFSIETIDIENIDGTTGTKVIINLPLI